MIKEVTMYTIVCDCCGKEYAEDSDYAAWADAEFVEGDSVENGWVKHGELHFCPERFSYDENGEVQIRNLHP
jgi:hypothetical protein